MLECRDCQVSLGGARVLDGVSLRVEPGRVVAVVGANGAGKSTLLRVLSGELAPEAGSVSLDGRPLAARAPGELARRRAVMTQASHLAFAFTAAEIVSFGAEAGGAPAHALPALVERCLARVDLGGLGERPVATLSGGQAQRVHLARALAQVEAMGEGGRTLLLDEPTASLDLAHQLQTVRLARAAAAGGVGVLAILHDINLAVLAADRIVALAGGRIVADGPAHAVVTDAVMEAVFGVSLPVSALPAAGLPFVLPQAAREAREPSRPA